jgi:hypothetical protein
MSPGVVHFSLDDMQTFEEEMKKAMALEAKAVQSMTAQKSSRFVRLVDLAVRDRLEPFSTACPRCHATMESGRLLSEVTMYECKSCRHRTARHTLCEPHSGKSADFACGVDCILCDAIRAENFVLEANIDQLFSAQATIRLLIQAASEANDIRKLNANEMGRVKELVRLHGGGGVLLSDQLQKAGVPKFHGCFWVCPSDQGTWCPSCDMLKWRP